MSYGFVTEVPATEEIYRSIRAQLGDTTPQGLVLHLVVKAQDGLRYIDVWDTQSDWERFRDEQVRPAVNRTLTEFGIPTPAASPEAEELQVVDVWVGAS